MPVNRLILDFEYDFLLLGVVSSIRDFTFVWHLNKLFFISLSKSNDLHIQKTPDLLLPFSVYYSRSENNSIVCVKNKSEIILNNSNAFLLPELKDYDYFVLLYGNSVNHWRDIMSGIKNLHTVSYIKKIDIEALKSRESLLLIKEIVLDKAL